nr:uncharacterized protein LOC117279465 [Nicotiana tomentosiformis]
MHFNISKSSIANERVKRVLQICTRIVTIPAISTLLSPASSVTPVNAIPAHAKPLTFGSFLPVQFQTIREEPEEGERNEHQLNLAGKRAVRRTWEAVLRRLQFSDLAKSTTNIPDVPQKPVIMEQETQSVEEKAYKRNRSSQMGKIT